MIITRLQLILQKLQCYLQVITQAVLYTIPLKANSFFAHLYSMHFSKNDSLLQT